MYLKWKQEFRSVTAKPIQAKIIKQPAGFSEAHWGVSAGWLDHWQRWYFLIIHDTEAAFASNLFLQDVCFFQNCFFFPLSLSHRIRSISWRDALTWRPTVKFYLRFSSRLRWNLFEATRRVSKRRGEAVCRCCAVRRTSNENWWHNYQLGCVCAVVACCVVSSHHSIRPLHVRCLCAN